MTSSPIFWLILTAGMTALFWIPYVLNAIMARGVMGALANPSPDQAPLAPWAQRAKAAHYNAIENLVVFATLFMAGHLLTVEGMLSASILYFVARAVHYVAYTLGIIGVRTLAFVAGWVAQMMLLWMLLSAGGTFLCHGGGCG